METNIQSILILKGAPSSGKSTYAKELMQKEPGRFIRINNDDLRQALHFGEYSPSNEKIIRSVRNNLIKDFVNKGYSLIIDNTNVKKSHFEEVVKLVENLNKDISIEEVPFYIELSEAIERDSKRIGKAKVGEEVVRKFWKDIGGKGFANYKPLTVNIFAKNKSVLVQNETLKRAVIFDNDGTISLLNGRNPYDATHCDKDLPSLSVIECMKLYYASGYKIIFISGREEKYRAPTERFYKKHFPEVEYELYMRPSGNFDKDSIIKENIYNNHIKNKYFVAGWFDDRLQVCKWVYDMNLPLFRVGPPDSDF